MMYPAFVMKFNLSHNESIFSLKILTDTLTVAFKDRQGRRGLVLLLLTYLFSTM